MGSTSLSPSIIQKLKVGATFWEKLKRSYKNRTSEFWSPSEFWGTCALGKRLALVWILRFKMSASMDRTLGCDPRLTRLSTRWREGWKRKSSRLKIQGPEFWTWFCHQLVRWSWGKLLCSRPQFSSSVKGEFNQEFFIILDHKIFSSTPTRWVLSPERQSLNEIISNNTAITSVPGGADSEQQYRQCRKVLRWKTLS